MKTTFKHCMVDNETLDNIASSVILSIGSVMFDHKSTDIFSEFYTVVNTESCLELGLTTSADTIQWWQKQTPEAQSVIKEAAETDITIKDAMENFNEWFYENRGKWIWSHGATFDIPQLDFINRKLGFKSPWFFSDARCTRTVYSFARDIDVPRVGEHHNALDDCKYQAAKLQKIFMSAGK